MVARASGSVLRRGCSLALLLVASLTACGGGSAMHPQSAQPARASQLLVPVQTIMGGRQAMAMDATGTPKPGSLRGYLNFISPAAIAVRGPDLYVADVGARKLYRLDTVQQALSVVPEVAATPRMRLQVGADLSLYVLDPDHGTILHITRGGTRLQTLREPGLAMNVTNFLLDERMGRILASDQLGQRLLRLPLAGRIVSALPDAEVGGFQAIGALAASGDTLYALDAACVCVVRLDAEGRVQERFGYDVLMQPHSMVADRAQRLFVADGFDRSLKVFQHGELVARYEPHQLGVASIGALAYADGMLYVSDGPGARVAVFRVQPPAGAGDARAR